MRGAGGGHKSGGLQSGTGGPATRTFARITENFFLVQPGQFIRGGGGASNLYRSGAAYRMGSHAQIFFPCGGGLISFPEMKEFKAWSANFMNPLNGGLASVWRDGAHLFFSGCVAAGLSEKMSRNSGWGGRHGGAP